MKTLKLFLVIVFISLGSCKLDPPYSRASGVALYITTRYVPKTGIVNQPVNITASGAAYSDCWSGLKIYLTEGTTEFNYTLITLGNFESYGTCNETLITIDSTLTFTPKKVGKYIVTTWVDPATSERDTVVVSAP